MHLPLSKKIKQAKGLAKILPETKFKMQLITWFLYKEHCGGKWVASAFLSRKERPKEVKINHQINLQVQSLDVIKKKKIFWKMYLHLNQITKITDTFVAILNSM